MKSNRTEFAGALHRISATTSMISATKNALKLGSIRLKSANIDQFIRFRGRKGNCRLRNHVSTKRVNPAMISRLSQSTSRPWAHQAFRFDCVIGTGAVGAGATKPRTFRNVRDSVAFLMNCQVTIIAKNDYITIGGV